MFRIVLLFLFFTSFYFGFSQSMHLPFKINDDTTTVRLIIKTARDSLNNGNVLTARDYVRFGITLANKISDKKGIALCYQTLGTCFNAEAENDSALYYFNEALKVCKAIGNRKGEGNQYNNMGLVYYGLGKYKEAVNKFLLSLKIRESIFDSAGIASVENNLGSIYWYQKAYKDANAHYRRAAGIYENIGDPENQALTLNNLALIAESNNDFKEAMLYYLKAIEMHKISKNDWGLGLALNGIGALFHYSLRDLKQAEKYYLESMDINQRVQNINGLGMNYENLGILKDESKDLKGAIKWFGKAISLYENNRMPQGLIGAYNRLSETYYHNGKFKEAYEYHVKYAELNDSINLGDKLAEMEAKYGKEKRDSEIILLKKEKEVQDLEIKQKRVIIYSTIGGAILLLGFIGFIAKAYFEKKKANSLLETKNTEITFQKHVIEEKHKEITDSINYAERIQRSFMATKKMLDANLEDYFIFFKPKDVVSGDFYWASKIFSSNGVENFALVTADSTGHGVPGAIMSLLNITSLEKALETENSPSKILDLTRRIIINRLKNDGSEEGGKDGMDCSLCVFDFENKILKVAAAHNPVWIVRENGVIEIKPDKMPVGKHDRQDVAFSQHEIQLQSGDIVYTLTDGFPDQFGGEKGKKFMSKNLRELLVTNAHLRINEQKELLEKTFARWKQDLEQVDDVTLIGIKIS